MAGDQDHGSSGAPALSKGVIGGVAAAGAGVFILLICIIILILRARRTHKRRIADLESRGAGLSRGPSIAEIPDVGTHRTRTVLRRNTNFVPYGANNSGWDSLHSNDSWHAEQFADVPGQTYPPVVPLSTFQTVEKSNGPAPRGGFHWPFGKRAGSKRIARPAGPISRLSAITEAFCESPRSQQLTPMPIIPDPDHEGPNSDQTQNLTEKDATRGAHIGEAITTDSQRTGSPLLDVPAIPARRPAPLFNRDGIGGVHLVQASRSKSIAYLPSSEHEQSMPKKRPAMHKRSVSLCTQKSGQAPIGPAPPLPVFLSAAQKRNSFLQVSPSRMSLSSVGSGGSSVLIHSPNPGMKRSHSGNLIGVTNHDWRNPMLRGLRPMRESMGSLHSSPGPRRHHTVSSRNSARSLTARCSAASFDSTLMRANSVASTQAGHNRLSVGVLETANRVSLSPVPSLALINQPVQSPISRRSSRFFVDARGSPVARYRSSTPPGTNEGSYTPPNNAENPCTDKHAFSFEPSPMQAGTKPSAMKGSPNGRKGHRRQNCVRIQLAPTILGPSPPHMNQIQEEDSPNSDVLASAADRGGLETRSDPVRPPPLYAFGQTSRRLASSQRSSLVASSSTMSLVNFCQDNGLPLEQLGLIPGFKAPKNPAATLKSSCPSTISNPAFPISRQNAAKRSFSLSMPHLNQQSGAGKPPSLRSGDTDEEIYQDAPSAIQTDAVPSASSTAVMDDLMATFLSLSSDDPKVSPGSGGAPTQQHFPSSPPSLPTAGADRSVEYSISSKNASKSSPQVSPKTLPGMFSFGGNLLVTEPVEIPWSFSPEINLGDLSSTPAEPPTPDSRGGPKPSSRSATVAGPRPPPAQPLGRAVQMLRRMNSDVGLDHRAERRYLGLCESEASLVQPSGIYRDSYADFSRIESHNAEASGQQALELDNGVAPAIGLGILGEDLDEESEIEIDEMLRSNVCGSEQRFTDGNHPDPSWLGDDEENLWGREDSGALGSTEQMTRLWSKEDLFTQTPQLVAGAEDTRRSSLCEDAEEFQELDGNSDTRVSRSPSLGPVEETEQSAAATTSEVPGNVSNEALYIPGLSLTTASSPLLPGQVADVSSVSGAEKKGVGARTSWGSGDLSVKKRKLPERVITMRKSAILNLSFSGHNRQKKRNKGGDNGGMGTSRKTPEPNEAMQKEWGTPGSLYDEDGFLKS